MFPFGGRPVCRYIIELNSSPPPVSMLYLLIWPMEWDVGSVNGPAPCLDLKKPCMFCLPSCTTHTATARTCAGSLLSQRVEEIHAADQKIWSTS